ncbi:hypothetical protein pdam_00019526 [Pocillopora damicornis]|uniref:CSC1/OSCA1-like cytosolic domain-containing protein n=1 Tax=Pocillopora damicornis TaxID=46731 RepID=A0A3M6TCA5_POCDA|nr:hypothetical protein pdam_00019526 [Pocillopora damicornis]
MANLYLEFDEDAGNNTHIIPKCYDVKDVNANSSQRQLLINYMAKDGGIPVNFGLNILGWMIVFILFCVIRRLVWDYGRLALIQKEDQGWTEMFYGSRQTSEEGRASQEGGMNAAETVEFPAVKSKKHLIVYSVIIFCLSIGIVLPVNYTGTNEPNKNSFGATTVSNLMADSSVFWLHTVFAIIYTVLMVIVLRHFTNLFVFESHDDSKKTIMMTNVPKNVTADLIMQHFREIYGESQVLEVQVAFDFVKLKQAQRKVLAAQMGREHCEELLRKTGERPLTTVSTNKLSPCCHCCGASHVDGIEYFTEEEEDGKVEADQQRQKLKSLGIAFVTFENAKIVQRHGSPESSVSRRIFSDHWNVSQAPFAGDIIWEHLSVDNESWWVRAVLINTLLFIFVLFLTTPAVVLSTLQELEASVAKSNPKLAVPPSPFLTQFLPTILLWSFAAILPAAVKTRAFCDGQDLYLPNADVNYSSVSGSHQEAVREFAYGQQYAWMLVIFTLMVVFCLTCPLVTPFGLLYLAMKHLVDRYNLYFNYRPPAYNYVDSNVHQTAVTFAVISTFFLLLSLLFYSSIRLGINDPQTVFTLVVVCITVLLLLARVCFGMFKKFGPHKEYLSTDAELNGADVYIPEAYLPPVLQTTREMKATGSGSDNVSPTQLTRRKTYGATQNDHVIDTSQLTPSSETVVTFDDEDRH